MSHWAGQLRGGGTGGAPGPDCVAVAAGQWCAAIPLWPSHLMCDEIACRCPASALLGWLAARVPSGWLLVKSSCYPPPHLVQAIFQGGNAASVAFLHLQVRAVCDG